MRCSKFNNNSKYHSGTKTKQVVSMRSAWLSCKSRFPFCWLTTTTCAHSQSKHVKEDTFERRRKIRLDITGRLDLAKERERGAGEKEKEGGRHQETLTYCECTFYIFYHFRNMCCPFGNRISIWPRNGIEARSLSISLYLIRTTRTDGMFERNMLGLLET